MIVGTLSRGWPRCTRFLADRVPDRIVLARRFKRVFGRPLDLKVPKTFNEKLIWLMLYYRTPLVTRLADKYAVRGYVAERVGRDILNELYGVWDSPGDLAFEDLPDSFVLKVTWGSQMNVLCRNKSELDVDKTRRRLAAWMRRNHYWTQREWSYKNIQPRIIAERLLVDRSFGTPPDYKFFCFGGEPRFVQVDTNRFSDHARQLFDLHWRRLPFEYVYGSSEQAHPVPENLDDMVRCARALSAGFPFVRVDLYSVNGRTVFGEMTWYPEGGRGQFRPDSYDSYWGAALKLPSGKIRDGQ